MSPSSSSSVDTAADQGEAGQKAYLDAHGITDLGGGVYHIDSDAIDFNYFVQTGNKGTWSQAHVARRGPPGRSDFGRQPSRR